MWAWFGARRRKQRELATLQEPLARNGEYLRGRLEATNEAIISVEAVMVELPEYSKKRFVQMTRVIQLLRGMEAIDEQKQRVNSAAIQAVADLRQGKRQAAGQDGGRPGGGEPAHQGAGRPADAGRAGDPEAEGAEGHRDRDPERAGAQGQPGGGLQRPDQGAHQAAARPGL